MTDFNTLQNAFFAAVKPSENCVRRARGDDPQKTRLYREEQRAAWIAHMNEMVWGEALASEFPEADASVLQYSDDSSVFANVGGLIVYQTGGLRVTLEAVLESRFVVAMHAGELTAMTVEQAFRRGLRDVEIPRSIVAS